MSLIDETILLEGAMSVTPSDSDDIHNTYGRGLYVGVSGDVKVTMDNGDIVTWGSLAAGIVHPFYVKRVWSTGTTATGVLVGKRVH
jgi:hypothetical protein